MIIKNNLTYTKFYKVIIILILFIANYSSSFSQIKYDKIKNLEILNTKYDDFAPVWNIEQNVLFYNSIYNHFSLFFTSQLNDSNHFSAPKRYKSDLNKENNNQSYLTFLNSKEAYFANYRQTATFPVINIAKAVNNKNSWVFTEFVDTLLSNNFTSQPSISPDGKFIVFVSNRNGNKDTDLYMALRNDDGNFSTIIPIEELNSPGNEITPFLLSPDTLFFASDGQEGPGKYDLFYSVKIGNRWQRAIALDDINTEFNESDFTILPNGTAIFASDRLGGAGNLDLYSANRKYDNENQKELENIEAILKAQTFVVNSDHEYNYTYIPIFNFFLAEDIDKLLNVDMNQNDLFDVDNLYKSSLSLIADKMLTDTNSILYLSQFSDELKFKNSFTNHFKISDNRIKFTDISIFKNIVTLSSDEQDFFNAIKIGKSKYKISPPVLQIQLDTRPKESIETWELNLFIGSKKILVDKGKNSLSKEIIFDLNEYASAINDVDNIELELIVNQNLQNETIKTFKMNVNHESLMQINNISSNNKKFEEYYIPVIDFENVPQNYLDFIYQRIENSKSVLIEYFNSANQTYAEEFKQNLTKIKKYRNPITSNLIPKKSIDKKYLDYLIKITVNLY